MFDEGCKMVDMEYIKKSDMEEIKNTTVYTIVGIIFALGGIVGVVFTFLSFLRIWID